jgi:vacuolar protein sorting-associated protein 13D
LFKQTKERKGYDYVISPVSGHAKLKRNLSAAALRSKSTPRIHCDLSLEEISISFTQLQYQSLIGWLKGLVFLERNRKYCRWRPKVPVRGNAKLWWEFAVNCHLEKSRKHRKQKNMDFVLRRARENIVYVEIYRRHLLDPMSLSAHEKEAKMHVEKVWTYEELRIMRFVVSSTVTPVDQFLVVSTIIINRNI